jgi:ribosomal protein S17
MLRLAGSGNELFGTVVRHGLTNKTIAVRVSAQTWNNKYKIFMHSHKNKLVHDETNYCVTGDKVIIKCTHKLSKQKAYYVKNIVRPFARDEFNRPTSTPNANNSHNNTTSDTPNSEEPVITQPNSTQ